MRRSKPFFLLPPNSVALLAKPSNVSFVLGFSPHIFFIPKRRKKENVACHRRRVLRCGLESAANGEKKNTFWGFLGPCYQNFLFFSSVPPFSFILRFLGPVFLFLDECSCAPQNRFLMLVEEVLQTTTFFGFSWTLLPKIKSTRNLC